MPPIHHCSPIHLTPFRNCSICGFGTKKNNENEKIHFSYIFSRKIRRNKSPRATKKNWNRKYTCCENETKNLKKTNVTNGKTIRYKVKRWTEAFSNLKIVFICLRRLVRLCIVTSAPLVCARFRLGIVEKKKWIKKEFTIKRRSSYVWI